MNTHPLENLIGHLLVTFALPRRRATQTPINQSNVHINFVEDLVDISLQEIPHPLDQIPPTPLGSNSSRFEPHYESEEDNKLNLNMDGNQNIIPKWMSWGALNFPRKIHDFPKCLEILLPKFDIDKSYSPEDHINKFYL
jgi:hypothetical protein